MAPRSLSWREEDDCDEGADQLLESQIDVPEKQRQDKHNTLPSERMVSFALERNDVHLIPHCSHYSAEEIQALYLSKREYRRIEKENSDTLRYMNRGIFPDSEKRYFRGLEVLLNKARMERQERQAMVLMAVLEEQEYCGRIQPQWFQSTVGDVTSHSADVARIMGEMDAEAAAEVDVETDTEEESSYEDTRRRLVSEICV